MSALTEDKVGEKAGKRFKLIVRSAEEAVRVIREKLGENARVLSVKQVGGEGLKRFISSPKLEVIAEIPSQEQQTEEANALSDAPVDGEVEAVGAVVQKESSVDPVIEREQGGQTPMPEDQSKDGSSGETARVLSKAGFDPALLSEIQSWTDWKKVSELPLAIGP